MSSKNNYNYNSELWLSRIEELYQRVSKTNNAMALVRLIDALIKLYKYERTREQEAKQLSLDEYINNLITTN